MTTNSSTDSTAQPQTEQDERLARANAIVQKFVFLSIGAGAIPIPIFDVAASVGLQLKLIQELSDLYGVDHRQDIVRNALGTIASTTGGLVIGSYLGSSMAKLVPVAGTKVGIVKTATFFGIATHISGKFLIMHFEAGGTLLDFDPVTMRNFFKDEYEKANYVVRQEQDRASSIPATP